jgi:peptidoglycan/xylan/chitin deacetylase (PgdA/CDA1 family)
LIALTFDDGPSWDYVNILDILKRNSIKATFFVLGKLLSGNAALSRRAIQEGHNIASHSYSHISLPGLGSEGSCLFVTLFEFQQ